MTRIDKRHSQSGYILVAVLGVMLLLTGLLAAGSVLVRSALDTAKIGSTDVPMAGLTQGGLELTAYQLFVIDAAPAAVDGRRIKFGGGTIASHIDDEGAKADLNASDPKLLLAVFHAVGLDGRIADALLAHVIEMRGPDRNPRPEGTPSTPAVNAAVTSPPTGAKKMSRGFQSIDQLADFPGLPPADVRALGHLLTVYNPDGKINVRSASPAMLSAVPGLSEPAVANILKRRDDAPKKEIEGLLAMAGAAQPFLKTSFGPVFTVRVDASSGQGRKKSINAVVAASKSPNTPYYVLDFWE